jgi:hypothetical protein
VSDDDHQHRRVDWDGHKGEAYFDGVVLRLHRAPKITGIDRVVELDYAPKRDTYFVREYRVKVGRPLTEAERQDIEARFGRMHNGAQDAWA